MTEKNKTHRFFRPTPNLLIGGEELIMCRTPAGNSTFSRHNNHNAFFYSHKTGHYHTWVLIQELKGKNNVQNVLSVTIIVRQSSSRKRTNTYLPNSRWMSSKSYTASSPSSSSRTSPPMQICLYYVKSEETMTEENKTHHFFRPTPNLLIGRKPFIIIPVKRCFATFVADLHPVATLSKNKNFVRVKYTDNLPWKADDARERGGAGYIAALLWWGTSGSGSELGWR